ncbi:PLP-dependent transferase [Nonomuraea sp. B10E15]|uniref:trans-sulfuration enzyme family protein n=1 Tax=Nonomuraea sp. B10E15 TaxID=3153560 RepID=UPI00325F303C
MDRNDGPDDDLQRLRLQTVSVAAGRPPRRPGEPLNVPLVMASNFHAAGPGQAAAEYSRDDGTPTWAALETAVGALEGGGAVAFASGMAAVSAIVELLPVGARAVVASDSYSAVRTLLAAGSPPGRWELDHVDVTDTGAVLAAARGADLLWLESPTNPLMDVADLPELCAGARAAGALVAVDNTFATPILQRPLAMGADIVMHSGTKFIGGHSDLLIGLAVTADQDLYERLRARRELAGATPGGLEAFLALRGLRTMAVRVAAGQRAAGELAERLHAHPAIDRVRYPGLAGDPGHARAAAQMDGFGAVLSFEVRGGARAADAVCAAVRLIHSATSLGGVESTIERRAKLPGQEHVPSGLLRLSVGCEHVEDLWDDLDQALVSAAEAGRQHPLGLRHRGSSTGRLR